MDDIVAHAIYYYSESKLLIWFCLLCFVAVVFSKYFPKKKQKSCSNTNSTIPKIKLFENKNVPHIVVGCWVVKRLGIDGLRFFADLWKKYGNVYEIPFGMINVTVITQASAIQKLLKSNSFGHVGKSKYIYTLGFMDELEKSLILSHPSQWLPQRQCLSHGFSYASLKSYLPLINKHSEAMIKNLSQTKEPNILIHGKPNEVLYKNVLNFTIELMMGYECSEEPLLTRLHERMATHSGNLLYKLKHPQYFLHILWKFHPRKIWSDVTTVSLRKTLQTIIKKHPHQARVSKEGNDNKARPLSEFMLLKKLSDAEKVDNICGFLIAEHEAACTAIEFILLQLSLHPKHQSACQQEVDKVFSNAIAKSDVLFSRVTLDINDLCRLKYIERTIMECLRLLPPIPLFARRIKESIEVGKDLVINAGKHIVIIPWVVHRNPKYFPDPEKFDPDRFLPENFKKIKPGSYIPFSSGPRNCIAWKFSLIQLKITIAWILRYYHVVNEKKSKVDNVLFAIKSVPQNKITLRLIKRTNADFYF